MKLQRQESNNCIVTRLKDVRPHPNADRLKLATVLGTQVVVGLDAEENQLVLYWDSNLRIGHEYLCYNNLYSNPDMNYDKSVKGYFPKSGRVKCQKFRGELSNGYVAELYTLLNVPRITGNDLVEGTEFSKIDGVLIAEKYIPAGKVSAGQPRQPKHKLFHRHWETEQLMRNVDKLTAGPVFIEEKVHGTSGRTAKLRFKKEWYRRIFPWQEQYEYKVVSGTRRVDQITYHMPGIRKAIEDRIGPLLHKGEQVYYEIFGYENRGKPIQNGFTYGCKPGEYKVMLYRVTFTNDDGWCVDMNRQYVYQRAIELEMYSPFVINTGIIYPDDLEDMGEILLAIQDMAEGCSFFDGETIKEGVVVWFQRNDGYWTCLKHKSDEFLLLESGQKDKEIVDCEDLL